MKPYLQGCASTIVLIMNIWIKLFVIICMLFCFVTRDVVGQGCSDAGFCTMGAMKPDQHYSRRVNVKLRSVEINSYRGKSTLTPLIYVLTADMTFSISNQLFVQVKLPYQWVEGSLGSTQGVGDMSLSLTRSLASTRKGTLSATLGGKIPTNNADLNDPNKWNVQDDLPMYYQVSLGSYDLVAGLSWINEKWLFATGIQIALTQNKNDFRWGDSDIPGTWRANYKNGESVSYVNKYDLANNLKRGIDVMLRIERNWRFTNFNFSLGLLPIYRITRDERFDFTPGIDKRIKEEGTTGLALSVLGGVGYNFDVNNAIKLIYGYKLVDRDVNPDGLTRDWVNSLSYVYRF